MDEVAHVVEGHDDHHEPAERVYGPESVTDDMAASIGKVF